MFSGPILGFPGDSVVKNPPADAEDMEDVGQEYPLVQGMATTPVFCLENSMDRVAWQVAKSRSWLCN